MSTEPSKATKAAKAANTGATGAPARPAATRPAPLFRPIDWLTLVAVSLTVLTGYWLTLAPDLGLEDSGELAVGSFYAGIPHPPGYPVWTIYTYFWANFLPFGNIAWRVALGGAFAGAFACGLLGLIVSRGSSMMIEGIESLKSLDRRRENAICLVSGFVAGCLIGFNGYMWSQAVIVEVYALSMLSLVGVLVCLLRFIYAPQQHRYAYWAFFIFGICFTNHQSLLVIAMGIEVCIAAVNFRMGRALWFWNSIAYLGGLILWSQGLMFRDTNPMIFNIFHIVGLGSIAAYIWFAVMTKEAYSSEVWVVALCGLLFALGSSFYLYMPIAGLSTPPMQWGYPRTVEGFMHALTRGQYEKANPSNLFSDPVRFLTQLWQMVEGVAEEFNWVYMLLAVVPLLFFLKMQKRERGWVIGVFATYLCLGPLLVVLFNPSADRQSHDLLRVFFTASHVLVAMAVGYGLTLIAATMATGYRRFRLWGIVGGAVAMAIALISLAVSANDLFGQSAGISGPFAFLGALKLAFAKDQYALPIYAGVLLLLLAALYLAGLLLRREQPALKLSLVLFAIMPLHSVLLHWSDNEQRGHLFGYWFGHDMFTPPFRDTDGRLSYDPQRRAELMKDPEQAKLIYPEMTRNAILYGGTDPGRFCPTYMIFCESFIPARCKPLDPLFDRRDVYIITQNALADGTYLMYIRSHYNKSDQIKYDLPFFQEVLRPAKEREWNYTTNFLARTANLVLDKPLIALGNAIEKRRRADGVYPPVEMYISTPEDSQKCFSDYIQDAQRRMQLNQLRQGEDVKVEGGRVQVSGQVAVMAINGLLTKNMFDKNPTNEFFVEESFPLEWMYPHLTPFGVIMKINRQPLPVLSEDILRRDHEFWSHYSERLIGNWITYDTSVKDIVAFVEKVYVRRNYEGFKGDRKFARDDQAQKAFSKLRSSIAGVYAWRLGLAAGSPTPPEYLPKTAAEQQRMMKEADFAFRQAFAFCPYSPEAVYRYMQLLLSSNRLDDAILIVQTALKLDPYNAQLADTLKRLQGFKGNAGKQAEMQAALDKMQAELNAHPTNFQLALQLAGNLASIGQKAAAITVMDRLLKNPHVTADAVLAVAQFHVQDTNYPKLEEALQRLAEVTPDSPESAYDLSAVKAMLGKNPEAMSNLKRGIELSDARLKTNNQARDMRVEAARDPRFQMVSNTPEFKALLGQP